MNRQGLIWEFLAANDVVIPDRMEVSIMSTSLDIVKRAYKAWETKDIDSLLPLLHENYRAKMSDGMVIEGHEGARKMIKECPDDFRVEDEIYVADGDKVVRIWTFVIKTDKEYPLRMAELNVLKEGKIIENEAIFNPTELPKEIQQHAENLKQHAVPTG